ncbi:hypothetical protein C475_02849 [Halosimplex carlsbadense 2-9-1]|uniref:Uncharacterized protein n=1 Tax=Halosimplex carlsbadense 2-9-1 TaxID=797114 RepID=M0D103_9EURY|nr:hypothetical protein [Halosimplex carlsbadense]ELZ29120.1 hypothetical protein C475_02849 [Halosimplex carlsbadense 2-9-1]
MYEIEADPRTNRLHLSFTGRMDREEMETAADETVEAAEHLRDGFDIINDLSGFTPPSPEAAKPIKRAQGELKEKGVDRVVRVTDEETSEVVVNAFERRSRDVGYSGETADSVAEADRKLDEKEVAGYASA